MDAANIDLKGFTERFYKKLCGGAARAGARDARSISSTRPTSGSRSRPCSSRARTTRDAEIEALSALGCWTSSARTCRCTSPPSIPTGRCWTSRATPAATLRRARAIAMRQRPALRLHRQRPRRRRPEHLLPRLRRAADRPRLVRHHRVEPHLRRLLCQMQYPLRRHLRASRRVRAGGEFPFRW